MLHTIDINTTDINKQPHITQYWITGTLSPCIKNKTIKIITNDNIKKNPQK